uniref:Leucine-rich repeat neuronal protein 4 n=1 Tax=Pogona vitticeps TaxID=103695 RepID=A0A6J0TLA5_9SAUR
MGFLFRWKVPRRTTMFCLFACIFLHVREMPAKPTETNPAIQGDVRPLFQLVKQNVWEENVNLTSLSCDEINNQTWTALRLKSQELTSFPACLPGHLERLDLSANLLPEFHSRHMAHLPKLQVLSLKQNVIRQVTWDAGSANSLRFLDLSFNLLSFVPACGASILGDLKWLSLAGNPITEIQPLAFSCYPQLHFLNLSSTWLGKDGKDRIRPSAFAINSVHVGDTIEESGSVISMLDLSATFLESIHQDWLKHLPRLTSLHLTKMTRLRTLEPSAFLYVPMLKELDCRDSRGLSLVETESFNHSPHLAILQFQNCNLSSFSQWNLSSSNSLAINLYGNPLICHCGMSWLLSKPDKIVLQRASETTCQISIESHMASTSGSMLLSNLHDQCETQRTVHLTPLFTQGKLLGTLSSIATNTLPDSRVFPYEWQSSPLPPQNTPLTWGDATPSTWGDTTQWDSTKANILAYKEETMYRSTANPPASVDVATTTSTILDELSAKQTVADTTGMEQDATVNSLAPLERIWYHSTLHSPTSEPTAADGFQVPGTAFATHTTAYSDQAMPPSRGPTKAAFIPNLATTDDLKYDVEDYDYEKDPKESAAEALEPCDYDSCRHLQKPCADLQKLSPCLCPGLSDEFTIPEPPRLQEVSEIRDTSAEIQWCAPNSEVSSYQLAYRPRGSKRNYTMSGEIYMTARRYTLYNLLPGSTYEVCVIASNKAGLSQTSEENKQNAPCNVFATKSSYRSVFAALCATSGLFLVATILLSACLCKKCRAPHIEHYNTHLVSYKNPAFDYSLK